jgi:hypothetical protein
MSEKLYKIVRIYHPSLKTPNEEVEGMDGLTLKEAQEHCMDEDSSVEGKYFECYQDE